MRQTTGYEYLRFKNTLDAKKEKYFAAGFSKTLNLLRDFQEIKNRRSFEMGFGN